MATLVQNCLDFCIAAKNHGVDENGEDEDEVTFGVE